MPIMNVDLLSRIVTVAQECTCTCAVLPFVGSVVLFALFCLGVEGASQETPGHSGLG